MKNVFMFPYKPESESCKELAAALGIRRIKHDNSTFKGNAGKYVINWGCTKLPDEIKKCVVFNTEESVKRACNKLSAYNALEGICPPFTTDIDVAIDWLDNGDVAYIVERHNLVGMGGDGIRLVSDSDELSDEAGVYCVYIPKKAEFRVHIIGGQVVDVQRKARRKDLPDDQVNWKVRNHANGFIYARGEDLGDVPEIVMLRSVEAIVRLGLVFGAVDVIYNQKKDRAYVLEVNTAPGLSGETVGIYKRSFEELLAKRDAEKHNLL